MSTFERIRYDTADGVATVTLDRPEKRNALDDRTVEELARAFERAEGEEGVWVALLRGAGPDFCAGADLAQLERIAEGAGPLDNLVDAERIGRLLLQMRRLPLPTVAAVHGHAVAGGAGLATACDIVLASEDATLGYPEVRLGFVPAMVMALLRRAVGEKQAFELVARGELVGTEEARRVGLINRVLPAATFEDDAHAYAADLAGRSPSAVRLIKRLLYGIDNTPVEEAVARGAEVNVLARSTEDTREGVRRFLEKRRS